MTAGSGDSSAIYMKAGVTPLPINPFEKVGIDSGALRGELPLNGLRHPAATGSSGWYIWAGEVLSAADDFFRPMHIEHLEKECPAVVPYLGLPPGWRFLIADGYEDVWFDETLLNVSN